MTEGNEFGITDLPEHGVYQGSLCPIVMFVFNRPDHTRKALEALSRDNLSTESTLYIYSDAPKSSDNRDIRLVDNVRKVIRAKEWCKKVVIVDREENYGLANNIINGVTEIVSKHGKVIVLEDDLIVRKDFLEYMNRGLELYENDEKVMHITAHIPETTNQHRLPETFFLRFMNCKGWATWKRAWDKALWDAGLLYNEIIKPHNLHRFTLSGNFNGDIQLKKNMTGELNTWAVFWAATVFVKRGLCLCPKYPLVVDIGKDGSGVHGISSSREEIYPRSFSERVDVKRIEIRESTQGVRYLKRYYKYGRYSGPFKRISVNLKDYIRSSEYGKCVYSLLRNTLKART